MIAWNSRLSSTSMIVGAGRRYKFASTCFTSRDTGECTCATSDVHVSGTLVHFFYIWRSSE